MTLYMTLGPLHFAWGHIRVGGSVYVLRKQIKECWSWCMCCVQYLIQSSRSVWPTYSWLHIMHLML